MRSPLRNKTIKQSASEASASKTSKSSQEAGDLQFPRKQIFDKSQLINIQNGAQPKQQPSNLQRPQGPNQIVLIQNFKRSGSKDQSNSKQTENQDQQANNQPNKQAGRNASDPFQGQQIYWQSVPNHQQQYERQNKNSEQCLQIDRRRLQECKQADKKEKNKDEQMLGAHQYANNNQKSKRANNTTERVKLRIHTQGGQQVDKIQSQNSRASEDEDQNQTKELQDYSFRVSSAGVSGKSGQKQDSTILPTFGVDQFRNISISRGNHQVAQSYSANRTILSPTLDDRSNYPKQAAINVNSNVVRASGRKKSRRSHQQSQTRTCLDGNDNISVDQISKTIRIDGQQLSTSRKLIGNDIDPLDVVMLETNGGQEGKQLEKRPQQGIQEKRVRNRSIRDSVNSAQPSDTPSKFDTVDYFITQKFNASVLRDKKKQMKAKIRQPGNQKEMKDQDQQPTFKGNSKLASEKQKSLRIQDKQISSPQQIKIQVSPKQVPNQNEIQVKNVELSKPRFSKSMCKRAALSKVNMYAQLKGVYDFSSRNLNKDSYACHSLNNTMTNIVRDCANSQFGTYGLIRRSLDHSNAQACARTMPNAQWKLLEPKIAQLQVEPKNIGLAQRKFQAGSGVDQDYTEWSASKKQSKANRYRSGQGSPVLFPPQHSIDIPEVQEESRGPQEGPVPQLNLNKLSSSIDMQNEISGQSNLMWDKGKATNNTRDRRYQIGQHPQVANIEQCMSGADSEEYTNLGLGGQPNMERQERQIGKRISINQGNIQSSIQRTLFPASRDSSNYSLEQDLSTTIKVQNQIKALGESSIHNQSRMSSQNNWYEDYNYRSFYTSQQQRYLKEVLADFGCQNLRESQIFKRAEEKKGGMLDFKDSEIRANSSLGVQGLEGVSYSTDYSKIRRKLRAGQLGAMQNFLELRSYLQEKEKMQRDSRLNKIRKLTNIQNQQFRIGQNHLAKSFISFKKEWGIPHNAVRREPFLQAKLSKGENAEASRSGSIRIVKQEIDSLQSSVQGSIDNDQKQGALSVMTTIGNKQSKNQAPAQEQGVTPKADSPEATETTYTPLNNQAWYQNKPPDRTDNLHRSIVQTLQSMGSNELTIQPKGSKNAQGNLDYASYYSRHDGFLPHMQPSNDSESLPSQKCIIEQMHNATLTLQSKMGNNQLERAYSNSNSRARGFHDRVQTGGDEIHRNNGNSHARNAKEVVPRTMGPPTPLRKGRIGDIRLPKVRMMDDKGGNLTQQQIKAKPKSKSQFKGSSDAKSKSKSEVPANYLYKHYMNK